MSVLVVNDREYWHVDGARSWHALRDFEHPPGDTISLLASGLCGRLGPLGFIDMADRIPPSAHLCGSCARIIAARTDQEDQALLQVAVAKYRSSDWLELPELDEGVPV